MKWFWWIGGTVFYLMFKDTDAHWGMETWMYFVVMAVILTLFSSLGESAVENEDKAAQEKRDREANEIAQEVLLKDLNDNLPLFLYLRPFTSDGKIFVDNPRKASIYNNLLITYQVGTPSLVNLQELILRAVEDYGLLLTIGKQDGTIGGGHVIASDENWRNNFVALAGKASCIFSVPSMNEGTLWELKWLAEKKMFSKVVMMFTELHFDMSESMYRLDSLKPYLAEMGWGIPEMLGSGSLITFEENGSIAEHIQKSAFEKSRIEQIALSTISVSTLIQIRGARPDMARNGK